MRISNSAQESSFAVETSTFIEHITSELGAAASSYSKAYDALSSSASVLLTASGETATSSQTASAGSKPQLMVQGFIAACGATMLGLMLGVSFVFV